MNEKVHQAFRRYQFAAWLVGTFLAMMTIALLRYGLGYEATWYKVGWQIHGFLFMIYLLATADLGVKARWHVGKMLGTAVLGTIPFMSFVAERRLRPQYQ